jgi:beta-mannosidase
VLCGGSEVAQQAAMTGLDPDLGASPLYLERLPAAIAAARVEVPYVPSTPWGGDLPFRPDRGVANYYGVGAYLRPLEDARRAGVKFASECLAFSNVPDEEALEDLPAVPHHPRWKAGIPRDVGAGWDFEDVRDHYLRLLYDVDPVALRTADPGRYLELSRQVTGEVMSEVFGEWRRSGSGCSGGLVLWLKDLVAGAGWGLLDHRGIPKPAYHHLRRALAPVAAWTIDEGLGGVVVHIANDGEEPVEATLRVAMYRDMEVQVEEVEKPVVLEPRHVRSENVEALLGRFVDASWAYRFGPPAQDLIAVSLERGAKTLSQTFRFPAGRPIARQSASELGLSAAIARIGSDAGARLTVSSKRFAYGVRVRVRGYVPDDDAFSLEPGRTREVGLRPTGEPADGPTGATGHLTALNLSGRVAVEAG